MGIVGNFAQQHWVLFVGRGDRLNLVTFTMFQLPFGHRNATFSQELVGDAGLQIGLVDQLMPRSREDPLGIAKHLQEVDNALHPQSGGHCQRKILDFHPLSHFLNVKLRLFFKKQKNPLNTPPHLPI